MVGQTDEEAEIAIEIRKQFFGGSKHISSPCATVAFFARAVDRLYSQFISGQGSRSYFTKIMMYILAYVNVIRNWIEKDFCFL